jgi:hypothetical protein
MENSDLYKEQYLKYKKEYLILKNQSSGGKILPSYYRMYVILDKESYDSIKRIVLHNDLGIQNINDSLIGSALKIMEDAKTIEFIGAFNKDDMVKRHIKRMSGSTIKVSLPEYRYKDNKKPVNNSIASLNKPYKFGSIYTNAGFIRKLANAVVSNLDRRVQTFFDDPNDTNDTKYDNYIPIEPSEPFHGIMVFRWTLDSCYFIEAYKLVKAVDEPSSDTNNTEIKINNIAILKDKSGNDIKVKLIKDERIFNPSSHFMDIMKSA